MHPNVHYRAIYNRQDMNAGECPLTGEWIKKMCFIYTMEYYSAFKKNEIMPFAARWMDLVVGIFSEVSQTDVKIAQSCLTLCNPIDYTVHGIL